ncbi:MAG: PEP/pyruvate-binding domain-containing protein, partial [Bdellovibrionales bacterium]|nr:PEP/pyruvate-binding domain-containing protein [Bdellovibrionales bacterium]
WHDIIVMAKVPEDIPRVGGIINAEHVTPLSHTNVLASGWQIPNCVQIGIFDRIQAEGLNEEWVRFEVAADKSEVSLQKTTRPAEIEKAPRWKSTKIRLEAPEVHATEILPLNRLRMSDRFKYGTKAANLGELYHVLEHGSEKLSGFYKIRRPPRANLMPYLATLLGTKESADLSRAAWDFLKDSVRLSNGVAIPFSVQQKFLESSPKIQQAIGKLKMALELDAPQVDPLCIQLQRMIVETRFPDAIREEIDSRIARYLGGVANFVVRSSSNAEDLQSFSAAGIYESVNHVTTADRILESIKQVWASVLSPRSVKLRQDVGISLDDTYMGVVIQEQVPMNLGGVMVTTNPISKSDFRNVYINASLKSVQDVVQGTDLPLQFLFNTVEGGGRTISLGSAKEDLPEAEKLRLQKLALAGRLLQAHFSPDYTFSHPVDVEWLANEDGLYILQLRPYTI